MSFKKIVKSIAKQFEGPLYSHLQNEVEHPGSVVSGLLGAALKEEHGRHKHHLDHAEKLMKHHSK